MLYTQANVKGSLDLDVFKWTLDMKGLTKATSQ